MSRISGSNPEYILVAERVFNEINKYKAQISNP